MCEDRLCRRGEERSAQPEPALQKSNSCATKALLDPNKHPGFSPGWSCKEKLLTKTYPNQTEIHKPWERNARACSEALMSVCSPALGTPEEALSWELMRGQATRGAPRALQGAALHPGADKAAPLRSFRSGRSQLSLRGAPGAPGWVLCSQPGRFRARARSNYRSTATLSL